MIKLLTDNAGKQSNYAEFINTIKKALASSLDIPLSELEKQIECDKCHFAGRRLVDEWDLIQTIETINPDSVGPPKGAIDSVETV